MRKLIVVCVVVAFGWVALGLSGRAQEAKAKYTIKEVMKVAHAKGKLRDKVTGGTASDAEKKELVEYYEALAANKPPMGDEASWKAKTADLLAAAKAVAAGDVEKLKAVKCADCHKEHKPK